MPKFSCSVTKLNIFKIWVGKAGEGGQLEAGLDLVGGEGYWRKSITAPGAYNHLLS